MHGFGEFAARDAYRMSVPSAIRVRVKVRVRVAYRMSIPSAPDDDRAKAWHGFRVTTTRLWLHPGRILTVTLGTSRFWLYPGHSSSTCEKAC